MRTLSLPSASHEEVKAGIYSTRLKLEKQHNFASPENELLFANSKQVTVCPVNR